MEYNFNSLSYMIAYFKELVESFGTNSKTVEFYKKQIGYLISIGQIKKQDYELIESLIGMENTDAIKWEPSLKRIAQFTDVVNILRDSTDKRFIGYVLDGKLGSGEINQQVYKLLKSVYNMDSAKPENDGAGQKSFGEYPQNIDSSKGFGYIKVYQDTKYQPVRVLDLDIERLEKLSSEYKNINKLLKLYNKNKTGNIEVMRACAGGSAVGERLYFSRFLRILNDPAKLAISGTVVQNLKAFGLVAVLGAVSLDRVEFSQEEIDALLHKKYSE